MFGRTRHTNVCVKKLSVARANSRSLLSTRARTLAQSGRHNRKIAETHVPLLLFPPSSLSRLHLCVLLAAVRRRVSFPPPRTGTPERCVQMAKESRSQEFRLLHVSLFCRFGSKCERVSPVGFEKRSFIASRLDDALDPPSNVSSCSRMLLLASGLFKMLFCGCCFFFPILTRAAGPHLTSWGRSLVPR